MRCRWWGSNGENGVGTCGGFGASQLADGGAATCSRRSGVAGSTVTVVKVQEEVVVQDRIITAGNRPVAIGSGEAVAVFLNLIEIRDMAVKAVGYYGGGSVGGDAAGLWRWRTRIRTGGWAESCRIRQYSA